MRSKTEILLESGTNELEIIEFTISGQTFGINVAKVREILQLMPIKQMQNTHSCIEGIIKPRDEVITVIDLSRYLNLTESAMPERDVFMVTEFNNQVIAFHVHTVEVIRRISWEKIQKPDRVIYGGGEGVATGIAEYENRLITILDFEKIIAEIAPQTSIQVADVDRLGSRSRSDKPILVAEDSHLLSKLIIESLHKAGYVNTTQTDNGQEAYNYLLKCKEEGVPIRERVALLISDIEMPQMDGHRLLKLVKEDPQLKSIPVVLFSSLINESMRQKGELLGADAQISKPEINLLVSILDGLLAG